jgi:hypothetical protein
MTPGGAVLAGFPNPVGWVIDRVSGFVGDVATAGFEALIGGLVAWVTDAVVWVVGGVFDFFLDAADPNVQADWFISGDGPYATTAAIGATLLVGFVLAGITQGALAGDVGGMLRRMAWDLPLSVLGIVGLVTVTQALIRLTDVLSGWVLASFEDDIAAFTAVVTSLSHLGGGVASAFVVLLLGLVTVLAGVVLVAELAVRAALVYLVVALAPLVFAARLWPVLRGVAHKLVSLLAALVLSKLVMAVALAVAASAAVGAGSGGEVTALPEPEVMAEDPGGSVTQAVGILLAAACAFGVAAFSPLLVARLLPLTEAAIVAQGVRSGPVRTAQSAASLAVSAQMLSAQRSRQLAAGPLAAMGGGPAGGIQRRPPRGGDPSAGAEWRVTGEPWARRTGAADPAVAAPRGGGPGAGGRRGGEATTGVWDPAPGERASPPAPSAGGGRRVPNRDEPAPPRGSPAAKHSPRPPGGRSPEWGGGDER